MFPSLLHVLSGAESCHLGICQYSCPKLNIQILHIYSAVTLVLIPADLVKIGEVVSSAAAMDDSEVLGLLEKTIEKDFITWRRIFLVSL